MSSSGVYTIVTPRLLHRGAARVLASIAGAGGLLNIAICVVAAPSGAWSTSRGRRRRRPPDGDTRRLAIDAACFRYAVQWRRLVPWLAGRVALWRGPVDGVRAACSRFQQQDSDRRRAAARAAVVSSPPDSSGTGSAALQSMLRSGELLWMAHQLGAHPHADFSRARASSTC